MNSEIKGMNARIIKTLIRKEMLDVLRDKKTVLMMLVVPLVLYPLIYIGAMQIILFASSSMKEENYRFVVEAEDSDAFLRHLMKAGQEEESTEEDSWKMTFVDADSISDYETALNEEEIDAYISGQKQNDGMHYDIYYLSSVTNSSYAANLAMDAFDSLKEELTREKLLEAGMDVHAILEPIAYEKQDTATSEQSLGSIMGSILPFMLVISLLMGTMYPAIDTTAGERERGTLETLLTIPVTNRQMIVSKFITVAVIGMVSALLNILSMGGIALYMYRLAELEMETDMVSFDLVKFLPAFLVCTLAIFAFSLFISAITMCVTSFAKSYKEANNYITPLMLVVMFIGYIGFIPNLELTHSMAMMPVANICMLIKNMLSFKVDYGAIALVLFSNIAYAVLAILFLSKIYDSESILFADGRGGLQLFEKRSNLKRGGVPTASDTWFAVALTTLLVLYGGSMLQVKFGLAGVLGTQLIMLLVPLAVVIYTKRDIRQTYGFTRTENGAAGYLGSALTAFGMFCINIVLATGLIQLFPQSAGNVDDTFSRIMGDSALAAVFVIAIAPAVCEEMLFRGMIFHSLQTKYRMRQAVLVTAVLFGIYHMSLVKFIPTGLLGLVLCLIVWRTGSIYPAMLMHFLNNLISVVMSYYPEQVGKVLPVLCKNSLSFADVAGLCAAGAVFLLAGGVMLRKAGRR